MSSSKSNRSGPIRCQGRKPRLGVERLEDRVTPANVVPWFSDTSSFSANGSADKKIVLVNENTGEFSVKLTDYGTADQGKLRVIVAGSTDPSVIPVDTDPTQPSRSVTTTKDTSVAITTYPDTKFTESYTLKFTPLPGATGQTSLLLKVVDSFGAATAEPVWFGTVTVRGYASNLPKPDDVAAQFKTTSYALPAAADYPVGVYYVAPEVPTVAGVPAGSTANSGLTPDKPTTVAAAYQKVRDLNGNSANYGKNAAVVFRGGTYRDVSVTAPWKHDLVLQAYPNEKPLLKGSKLVTNWTSDGAGRWYTSSTPGNGINFEFSNTQPPESIDATWNPLSWDGGQVYINGQPMWQVGSVDQVKPGTFYLDRTAHRVYIGQSPTAATIEVTAYRTGVTFSYVEDGTDSAVRGLNFMHYADQGIYFNGTPVKIEDSTFAWNGVYGAAGNATGDAGGATAPGSVIVNSQFIANGSIGLGLNYHSHNTVVTGNTFSWNNAERSRTAWAASGFKLTSSSNDVLVKDNAFVDNYATGFWVDVTVYRTMIVRNEIARNLVGAHVEISHDNTFAYNLVHHNQNYGLIVTNSSNTRVYNNTLASNGVNFFIRDTARVSDLNVDDDNENGIDDQLEGGYGNTDPREYGESADDIKAGTTWDNYRNVVRNNIFFESMASNTAVDAGVTNPNPVHGPFDPTTQASTLLPRTSKTMFGALDSNVYFETEGFGIKWDTTDDGAAGTVTFTDLPSFTSAQGFEANGLAADPLFVGGTGSWWAYYRLRQDSPAVERGADVPADILAAVGRSVAAPKFLGAVDAVNYAPRNVSLSNLTIAENAGGAAGVVGTVSATDPDGNALTYTVPSDISDNWRFEIVGDQLRVKAQYPINFETTPSQWVTVVATDPGGLTSRKAFKLTVLDANEAPTDITLSNSSVGEDRLVGTAVGTISAADPDAGETPTYALVPGTGADNNSAFTIVGNQLRLSGAAYLSYENQPTLTARVRVTDRGGLTFEKAFTVTVTEVGTPTRVETTSGTASLAAQTSGASVSVYPEAQATGGYFAFFDATAAGQSVTYSIPSVAPGTYELRVRVRYFTDRGVFQASASTALGGTYTNVGAVKSLYAASASYESVALGTVTVTTTGTQYIRFTATGAGAGGGYKSGLDWVELKPVFPTRREIGAAAEISGGTFYNVDDPVSHYGGFGRFNPTANGSYVTFRVTGLTAGQTYYLRTAVKRYSNRAMLTVSYSGSLTGPYSAPTNQTQSTFDQYTSDTNGSLETLYLGRVTANASGEVYVRFTVTGYSASRNTLAFDWLDLSPVS